MSSGRNILITGMSGLIGGLAGRHLARNNIVTALGRRQVVGVRTTVADIADFDAIRPAFEGVDTVIHMAASRGNQPLDVHLTANIAGVHNVFEAARQAGVRRIVGASSGAVISGYERDEPYASLIRGERPTAGWDVITTESRPRPRNLYSASKLAGEALAAYFAEAHGMSIICIRVGKVEIGDVPANARAAAVWCSHRDIVQVIEKCVDAPDEIGFEVVYGVSDNPTGYRDWHSARDLVGYEPQDSAADHGF
jgi:NAD+ dependent glucose-6-phosphate dehydrogenase